MALRQELRRFTAVGAAGFAIEAVLLYVLVSDLLWSAFAARAISFPAAMMATFLLNRAWTFRAGLHSTGLRAFSGYAVIQTAGAALNLVVYLGLLAFCADLRRSPVIALAIGAGVGLMFNFGVSRALVFKA